MVKCDEDNELVTKVCMCLLSFKTILRLFLRQCHLQKSETYLAGRVKCMMMSPSVFLNCLLVVIIITLFYYCLDVTMTSLSSDDKWTCKEQVMCVCMYKQVV